MTALEILQPHKSKKFVAIKDYDFDIKAYSYSDSTQKLGKLMLVLVDGPESLTIREAAKRLGLTHSHAKYVLKQSRHRHEKSRDLSYMGFAKEGTFQRFPKVFGEMNEEEDTLITDCSSQRGSQSNFIIHSEANSSDFSDIEALDNPDRKSSNSSFKRLSAFSKEKLQSCQNTGSEQSIACSSEKELNLLREIREVEEECSIRCQAPYIHCPLPVRGVSQYFTQSTSNEGQVISSHQSQKGDNDTAPCIVAQEGGNSIVQVQRISDDNSKQTAPKQILQGASSHFNIHQKVLEEVVSWKDEKWIGLDFLIKYLSLEVQKRIAQILEKCPQNPAIIQAFLDALRGK